MKYIVILNIVKREHNTLLVAIITRITTVAFRKIGRQNAITKVDAIRTTIQ